ncbi:MAG: NrfD/PsrC family molybdoenzyme membrane anchor subunit [Candidatus Omnitrophota bacterium]
MNKRIVIKSILWAFVSAGLVLAVARFFLGLGATTALSDDAPWGLWIAFDVMGGVALAAGGFVIAATVYIFHLEKYRPILRPAVLTAFLGYVAVVVGLQFDLGLPWRIWHAMIYWQHHSVLFEVAWCVMLYLTVLALEFAPVALEHPFLQWPILQRIHKLLKFLTIPLVIAGIMLSTLHQSSLGSLFLIMPYRLHPLWYTPIIPALFFVSAIGLGLMMVTLEAFVSSWLFDHKPKIELLSGLGRAASVVLFLYILVRFTDLTVRGQLGFLAEGSWQSLLFFFENAVSALIPAILLSNKKWRSRPDILLSCAIMVVFGMVLNRLDVGIAAIQKSPGYAYFPTWMEIGTSLSIVAAAALAYIFCAENFRLFIDEKHEEKSPEALRYEKPQFDVPSQAWLGDAFARNFSVFSIVAVLTIAFTAAILPSRALSRYEAKDVPVQAAQGWDILKIDGNRTGEYVLFDHKDHIARLQVTYGEREGCIKCHHARLPKDGPGRCGVCHSDMYKPKSNFDHAYHQSILLGNKSCAQCHPEGISKSKETAKVCSECHRAMFEHIDVKEPDYYIARGYVDAMHDLCIPCHTEQSKILGRKKLAQCAACHANPPGPAGAALNIENADELPRK